MKHTVNVWVLDASSLPELRRASNTPEILNLVQLCPVHVDMTQSCWVHVGTAEVEIRLTESTSYKETALGAVDDELARLETKYARERNALRELRSCIVAESE